MRGLHFLTVVVFLATYSIVPVYAGTVELISESSGVYENGIFRQRNDSFRAVYHIDEDAGRIERKTVILDDREGRSDEKAVYEITNELLSGGFSALTVSASRKGQKILTAVREGHLGSFDVILIGEDFYEFLSASGGRFYLESGRAEFRP